MSKSGHPPKPTKVIPVTTATGKQVHQLELRPSFRWGNGQLNTVCQHAEAYEFLPPGTPVTCKACLKHY